MNRTTIIAGMLAGVLATPTGALAEPVEETPVRIEVDVSALPKADFPENTRQWIVDNQTAVLGREGFVVTNDAIHAMRIEVSRYGEDGIHLKARMLLVGDPGSVREITCEACLNSQFLKKVDEETAVLAGELRQKLATAEPEPVESEPEPEAEPEADDEGETGAEGEDGAASDEPTDRDPKAIGPAGFAGIGTLAVGLGVTLGGIIVLAQGPEERLQASSARFIETVDRRPLGRSLTGIGAGMLATGVVLVVVDQTVLRKRRARRSGATSLAPALLPNGAGLSWAGRF
ncbi:hypothetical protein [Paraliomyxa miuraensis]|uniref:hypothetical protein n=1 Tax=Paraliomyxa miuraensis TaxID=376150 RepID=UPI0022522B9C|nr:hypothetical protein [Paraliomyxa miuraensis]MCX4240181.1 hypothetical protein [Paraliomyxa miuraensis]